VQFHTAVYTNLSRDHLDYHIDLRSYADAKARLFRWPDLQSAVLNADDGFGRRLAAMTSAEQTILYTLGEPDTGEVAGQWLIGRWDGRQLSVSGDFGMGVVESGLVGEFNAANLLGALGALLALRVPFRDALELISKVRPAPGRMERFEAEHCADVYVDYAHTPDALQSALGALAETYDEIWCVFGCGGERDRGKRPEMGAVAEKFSAHVVLTDDNPRRESGDLIIKDILTGMRRTANTTLLRDRRAAIEYALTHAGRDCCVLVAGKGHEQVQVLGNRIEKFDDRQVVQALMRELLS
jgi:UDP-N-acetylmuramoyl-L-alanyl-D-glutamate--2,6-diaminopimelate ligase